MSRENIYKFNEFKDRLLSDHFQSEEAEAFLKAATESYVYKNK